MTFFFPDSAEESVAEPLHDSGRGVAPLPIALTFCGFFLLSGCAATPTDTPAPEPATFAEYVEETRSMIAAERRFATPDHEQEIDWNAPWEMRPEHPDGRAVLFAHGLGEAPYTFLDTAKRLAEDGILVRTVLLPGHGTKPEDMIERASGQAWLDIVRREKERLQKEGYRVWLAGFSTGGNIAMTLGQEDPNVEGLVLFSPAPFVRTRLVGLVPVANFFFEWLRTPEEAGGGTTAFRYRTLPMTGLEAYYDTMTAAEEALEKPYRKPVLTVLSEFDSIVDTQRVLEAVDESYLHPRSRTIWYGDSTPKTIVQKVLFAPSSVPEERIRSFSHLSVNFAPENPFYGRGRRLLWCAASETPRPRFHCELPESEVWYGTWGEKRDGHTYVRLTYNPHFEWQTQEILRFLQGS